MAKKVENIDKIIAFLRESPRSKDEIMTEIGLGPDSWHNYGGDVRKKLKLEGETLKISKGVYSIVKLDSEEREQDEERMDIALSSTDTVMEVLILNALSQKASKKMAEPGKGLMTSRELTEDIFMNTIWDENDTLGDKEELKIIYPYSLVDSVLGANKLDEKKGIKKKGLIQKGVVEMYDSNISTQRTYDLTTKAPVYLKLSYGDEAGCVNIFDLKNTLQNGGQGYAFSDVLEGIDDLMSLYIGEDRYDISEYYKKLGISGNKKSKIEKFLNKLNKIDFKNRVLDIEYKPAHPVNKTADKSSKKKDAKNQNENYKFAVGLVFYASDKDRLYLLGKKTGAGQSEDIIMLNAERIVNISESKKKNTIYSNPEFLSVFDEMFSASIDGPFELMVEFDRYGNIEAKLKRMRDIRPNAVIKNKPGDPDKLLYYEAEVRGIEDVARWIRTFGRAAKVIKPNELKKKMKESIDRTLAYYEEGQEDE